MKFIVPRFIKLAMHLNIVMWSSSSAFPNPLCSHLGYSNERQLSLDLVNVGRQRLDFLPLLEHSGTFRETAMHSGTFAQEIITLVHHVKGQMEFSSWSHLQLIGIRPFGWLFFFGSSENYFQGQGITLNERFSNEHEYSLTDEFADEEQETEGAGPVVNRYSPYSHHITPDCHRATDPVTA